MLSASPSKVTLSRQNAASWTHPQHNHALDIQPDVSLSTHPAYHSDRERSSSPSPGWPSLHHEVRGLRSSAITAPSSLLHRSPPQCAVSGTLAFGFRPRRTPAPAISGGTTTRLVPEFRTRARTTFLPPLRRTPPGQERDNPARLVPGKGLGPGFDVGFLLFDASSRVRFRSTPWCTPDRGSPAVSYNAQDPCS